MKLEWRDVAPGDGPAISTSLTLAETDELRRLAKDAEVLEVGSAYGYSAIAMALAGAKSVDAVDLHTWLRSFDTMVRNVDDYAVADRVHIRPGDSRVILPAWHNIGRRFDLVWIDGDHAAEVVASDVYWARKLVRPGGVIACHDHGEVTCPGVAEALDAWRPYDYKVDTLAVYLMGDGARPGAVGSGEASRGEARHGWVRLGSA